MTWPIDRLIEFADEIKANDVAIIETNGLVPEIRAHFWLEMELRQLARKYAAMSPVDITDSQGGVA